VWDVIKNFAESYPGGKTPTAEQDHALARWISRGLQLLDALGVRTHYGSVPVFDPPQRFNEDLTPQERCDYLCERLGLPRVRVLILPLANVAAYFTGRRDPEPRGYETLKLPDEPPPKPDGRLAGTIVISEPYAYGMPAGAVIAHELGHAYLYFLRLQGIYFWLGHEAFTDLTSVALGLGKLYLNGIAEQEVGYLPKQFYARAHEEFCQRAGLTLEVTISALGRAAFGLMSSLHTAGAYQAAGRDMHCQGPGPRARLLRQKFDEVINSFKAKDLVAKLKEDAQYLYQYGVPGSSAGAFQELNTELQQQVVLVAARQNDNDIRAVLTWLVERYRPDLSHLLHRTSQG
jgi:hypothetical protein